MSRAFAVFTGRSVSGYLRGRRLTEAAKILSEGAPDILCVALGAGYKSHEAFTRAFRDQFGFTPEQVRTQGHVENIPMVEALKMDKSFVVNLQTPRTVEGKAMLIAGIGARYNCATNKAIPSQWQQFNAYAGNVSGQVGDIHYGVCCNSDEENNFDYIAGMEFTDFSDLPDEFSRVRIPAQRYLVFTHRDHISSIRSTMMTIWASACPSPGMKLPTHRFPAIRPRIRPTNRQWRPGDLDSDQELTSKVGVRGYHPHPLFFAHLS